MRAWAARWYSIPLLLLAWHLVVAFGLVRSRLLPDITVVWTALATDIGNGILLHHAGVTVARALTGFALAVAAGVPLAAALARSALFARLFEPVFLLGYPVPKIALFPVFAFVFGIGNGSKVSFTVLECIYPIVLTTLSGIRGIQTQLIWSARNMGADRLAILMRVMVPAALPSIYAGMRIALPVAMAVVIVTEMIGDTQGLGYYVTIWSTRFRYGNVYAGMVTMGACGFILDRGLFVARRFFRQGPPAAKGREAL
jgi:NitT/TauT family transport system permease protein